MRTAGRTELAWRPGAGPEDLEGMRCAASRAYALQGVFLFPEAGSVFTNYGAEIGIVELPAVAMDLKGTLGVSFGHVWCLLSRSVLGGGPG